MVQYGWTLSSASDFALPRRAQREGKRNGGFNWAGGESGVETRLILCDHRRVK